MAGAMKYDTTVCVRPVLLCFIVCLLLCVTAVSILYYNCMRGPYLIPSPLPVLLRRFLAKQISKWKKTHDEREKLLADAQEAAERKAEGDDDEDGKREGLSSSMWVSAVHVYVCTRMCAYVRARARVCVCVCVCVFKLPLVGSVYMYALCTVLCIVL